MPSSHSAREREHELLRLAREYQKYEDTKAVSQFTCLGSTQPTEEEINEVLMKRDDRERVQSVQEREEGRKRKNNVKSEGRVVVWGAEHPRQSGGEDSATPFRPSAADRIVTRQHLLETFIRISSSLLISHRVQRRIARAKAAISGQNNVAHHRNGKGFGLGSLPSLALLSFPVVPHTDMPTLPPPPEVPRGVGGVDTMEELPLKMPLQFKLSGHQEHPLPIHPYFDVPSKKEAAPADIQIQKPKDPHTQKMSPKIDSKGEEDKPFGVMTNEKSKGKSLPMGDCEPKASELEHADKIVKQFSFAPSKQTTGQGREHFPVAEGPYTTLPRVELFPYHLPQDENIGVPGTPFFSYDWSRNGGALPPVTYNYSNPLTRALHAPVPPALVAPREGDEMSDTEDDDAGEGSLPDKHPKDLKDVAAVFPGLEGLWLLSNPTDTKAIPTHPAHKWGSERINELDVGFIKEVKEEIENAVPKHRRRLV